MNLKDRIRMVFCLWAGFLFSYLCLMIKYQVLPTDVIEGLLIWFIFCQILTAFVLVRSLYLIQKLYRLTIDLDIRLCEVASLRLYRSMTDELKDKHLSLRRSVLSIQDRIWKENDLPSLLKEAQELSLKVSELEVLMKSKSRELVKRWKTK